MNAKLQNLTPVIDPESEPDDDIPDLTTPYWAAKFAAARVQRGRPKSTAPKISTTLRLDPEVLEAFKSSGPGWQSRMNEALRKAAGL
ncbi:BrnA antitoxin family protein [Cypionkella sp.]|uniref:BrnA antitoxin family protein n=1 Tax=Cypionkella sp. TaxID=2811411 RepID=UPI002AC8C5D1|nr:BrnA antitoxin family protein [Cypionkella sp.]